MIKKSFIPSVLSKCVDFQYDILNDCAENHSGYIIAKWK